MLYEHVKRICKSKGVTISEAERSCGFKHNYLRKLGGDNKEPGVYKMLTLARFLDVSIEELIDDNEEGG